MKKTIQILTLVALAALLLGSASATAQDAVTVSINAPAEVVRDSDFTASVDVAGLTDFDAGQFDVSFNESVLRLDDVTSGLIDTTEIPVTLWNKISPGTYRVIVNVPGVPGVSGSGFLAVLHFHATGSAGDSSTIGLSNGFLNNNLGTEITAIWTSDSVTVHDEVDNQTSAIPKFLIAAPFLAIMVGLVGYSWLKRRKAHKE
jgi:hypothetical protein